MRRREFITVVGGAAVSWPLTTQAQQAAMPVIGFLSSVSPEPFARMVAAFRQGLNETGYVEGQNVAIEYRWAEGQYDRLPALAANLVERPVALIVASGGDTPALAAKAATSTIPIVFTGSDFPVKVGLVAGLARPGGNATGINFFLQEIVAKRFEILLQLQPKPSRISVLLNPADPMVAETTLRDVQEAARAIALPINILKASTNSEIDAAFAALVSERADALFVASSNYFHSRRVQLAVLAARYRIPVILPQRDLVEAGGLMSYRTDITDSIRQVGIYAGKVLKGAKPADLPVAQSTKFEFVINLQTARSLGIDLPATLLTRADKVIE